MTYQPPLDIKRAQITNAREQFRQQGFACELDIEALKVQEAGDGESVETKIQELQHTRDNAYRSARRMDEMLAKLPKPKAESPNPATRRK